MTGPLTVIDIAGYLRDTGWERQPETWRGAAIWSCSDGYDVLVPGRDGMGDGDLRVREIVTVLAEHEQRPGEDITRDIGETRVDTQWVRTFPDGQPSGVTGLRDGMTVLGGVLGAFRATARAVLEGPQLAFRGEATQAVGRFLASVQLGAPRPGSFVLPVRVPLDAVPSDGPGPPLGRLVTAGLHNSVAVLNTAVDADEPGVFDTAMAAGVSADLCESLAALGGAGRAPFEIGFRWARAVPAEAPAGAYRFAADTVPAMTAAAARLRRVGRPDLATMTGLVEKLHQDQLRIEVRGELAAGTVGRKRRVVWVHLPDRASYDAAIVAHRDSRPVRATGVLNGAKRPVELAADPDGFEVLD